VRVTNRRLILSCLASSLLLVACTSNQSSVQSATPTSSVITPPPPHYNALSGRIGPDGQVLAVKVDDTDAAHPQIGIDDADVVYVEQVEGGLTRLAAIFSSSIPAQIGPVRSARISDIDLLGQYGKVAFAYSGAQSRMLPIIAAANLVNLGAERESSSLYPRDRSRTPPVNLLVNAPELLARAPDAVSAHTVGWSFGSPPISGKPVISVTVTWPASRYQATWSENEKRWLLTHDRSPDLAASGYHLGPSTLVIQQVYLHPSPYVDKLGNNTPMSETIGTGTGWILRNGQSFAATWTRTSMADGTHWRLVDSTEIRFAPGSIWVFLSDRSKTPFFDVPVPPTASSSASATPSSSVTK
jgi:hypothetical protein